MHPLIERAPEPDETRTATRLPSNLDRGPQTAPPPTPWSLIGAAAVGAAVALGLGLYGRAHQPTGAAVAPLRPENLVAVKSAFATAAAVLALAQLGSALRLYGRLGRGPAPAWLGPVHRWTGTAAFVATLPAAYHCLWGLGFQDTTTRVLVHSVLGCAFYGAFATKLLVLHSRRVPRWALPLLGSALVTLLVALWFTSAWWFYRL